MASPPRSGLDKQVITVPLTGGLDTKNAPPLVANDKFLQLQNAVFDKGTLNTLHKRNGYLRLAQTDVNGVALTAPNGLAQFGNEIDLICNDSLYSYSTPQASWVNKGGIVPIVQTERQVTDNSYIQSTPDCATLNGVTVYAWEDSRGGVWAKVVDETTGAILSGETQLSGGSALPRVFINGATQITIFSSQSSGVVVTNVSTVTPTAPLSATVVTPPSWVTAGRPVFEVQVFAANNVLVYQGSDGKVGACTFAIGTSTFSARTVWNIATTSITSIATQNLSNTLVASWTQNGTLLCYFVNSATLSTVTTPFVAAAAMGNIVCGLTQGSTTRVEVYSNRTSDGSLNKYIFDSGSGFVSVTQVLRGVSICSQVFAQGGVNYLLVNYVSQVQQQYFLINSSGVVCGRYLYSDAGPAPSDSRIGHPAQLSSGIWILPVTNSNFVITGTSNTVTKVYGVLELKLDFTQTKVRSAQLGQNLTVAAGSMPYIYDGTSVFEQGFNVYPEAVTATILNSQISVINNSNLNTQTAAPYTYATITFAANQNSSTTGVPQTGNDGALITPGEYISVSTSFNQSILIYFVVDGNGSAPTGIQIGTLTYAVNISAKDSAATIARKTQQVMLTIPALTTVPGYPAVLTFTVVGAQLTITGSSLVPWLSFFLNRSFGSAVYNGAAIPNPTYLMNGIPGNLITNGQYIAWYTYGSATANVLNYVYFTGINGVVAADPVPFAGQTGIPVTVNSSMTEWAVANAIINAVNSNSAFLNSGAGVSQVLDLFYIDGTAAGTLVNSTTPLVISTLGAGLGSSNTTGFDVYGYQAVYEQVDARGQLHRSAPSPQTLVYLPANGLKQGAVQVTVNSLRLSSRQNVDIAIYRTPAQISSGVNNLQRVTSPTSLLYNIPTADTVTFSDSVSDVALASAEFLYTSGGIVQNDPAPAMRQIFTYGDRLWATSLEDPQLIWWSKFFQPGVAVEWSAQQTTRIDPVGGAVQALISMDSNMVVLCASQIWIIGGSGPNAAGIGAAFVSPQLVSGAVGCRDQDSPVLLPVGIMFKSAKGFVVLNRALQVDYDLGKPVYAFVNDVVTSADVIPNTTQIRFLSQSGTTQLYDYDYDQWGSFTNHQGIDTTIFNGTYYYLRSNGAVYQENPGNYYDDQTGFGLLLQTSWLKFAGINGYQRCRYIIIQGSFFADMPVQVQLAVDEYSSIIDTQVFNAGEGSFSLWGSDATWGASTWGGSSLGSGVSAQEIRYDPPRQTMKAIQLTIQDIAPFSATETIGLDSLDLYVGVKRGGYRVPSNQRIG